MIINVVIAFSECYLSLFFQLFASFGLLLFCRENSPKSKESIMMYFNHVMTVSLLLLSLAPTNNAQWAQSIGWGGAGIGKRGSEPSSNLIYHLLRNSQTQGNGACLVNPQVLKRIDDIVQVCILIKGHATLGVQIYTPNMYSMIFKSPRNRGEVIFSLQFVCVFVCPMSSC